MSETPVQTLIKDQGGPTAVATRLNMRPETVQMWVTRRRIPRNRWPDLIEAFPSLTLETLKAVEAA